MTLLATATAFGAIAYRRFKRLGTFRAR